MNSLHRTARLEGGLGLQGGKINKVEK